MVWYEMSNVEINIQEKKHDLRFAKYCIRIWLHPYQGRAVSISIFK